MAQNQLESFVSAARRMSGAHGGAYIGGVLQTDVVEVTVGIEVGRTDVILVGQRRVGQKATRINPDGTLRVQKIDTRWELFVYNQLAMSDDTRREYRDAGNWAAADPTFDLKLTIDDPQGYAREAWQLEGCRIWRMTLGSSQADDTIEKEYPLTWERESPIDAFEIHKDSRVVKKYASGNAV